MHCSNSPAYRISLALKDFGGAKAFSCVGCHKIVVSGVNSTVPLNFAMCVIHNNQVVEKNASRSHLFSSKII